MRSAARARAPRFFSRRCAAHTACVCACGVLLSSRADNVSYFTPRAYKDQFDGLADSSTGDHIVFFGLQYLIKEYLAGCVVTQEKVDEAEAFVARTLSGPHSRIRSALCRSVMFKSLTVKVVKV